MSPRMTHYTWIRQGEGSWQIWCSVCGRVGASWTIRREETAKLLADRHHYKQQYEEGR